MKIRIAFRSDIIIEGDTMKEIRNKWEEIQLFSNEAEEANVCFLDVDCVEDAETYKDIEDEFWKS